MLWKDAMHCRVCDKESPQDALFCMHCGISFEPVKNVTPVSSTPDQDKIVTESDSKDDKDLRIERDELRFERDELRFERDKLRTERDGLLSTRDLLNNRIAVMVKTEGIRHQQTIDWEDTLEAQAYEWDAKREKEFEKWHDLRYGRWPNPGRVVTFMLVSTPFGFIAWATVLIIIEEPEWVSRVVGVFVSVYFVIKWYTTREEKAWWGNVGE